ncbi:MAG: hypothetical protein ACT4P7_21045 [Gemmatimonadaceae bacterium]
MSVTDSRMTSQHAPCGRIVDVAVHQDQDEEVMLTEELDYACGCQSIRHEYHDGSVRRKVTRHDGTVLVDELLSSE